MTIVERITTKKGYRVLAVVALVLVGMNLDYKWQQEEKAAIVMPVPVSTLPVFAKMTTHVPASTVRAIVQHSPKYPKTLTAIAAVESGKCGKTTTKGDKGQSRGIFQVQRKHWGHEGDSLEAQVRKADWVFDQLVQEHGYRGAVKAWNGSGKQAERYRQKVYAKLGEMR